MHVWRLDTFILNRGLQQTTLISSNFIIIRDDSWPWQPRMNSAVNKSFDDFISANEDSTIRHFFQCVPNSSRCFLWKCSAKGLQNLHVVHYFYFLIIFIRIHIKTADNLASESLYFTAAINFVNQSIPREHWKRVKWDHKSKMMLKFRWN